MTKKQKYMLMAEETLDNVLSIVKAKNHDYTSDSDDPFANFRLSTLEGVEPSRGLLIRVQDKLQRIRTFLSRGTLQVDGEGVDDAIHDIIGYMLILKGMVNERKEEEE